MGRIVVGVDGSEGSRRALEWAVEEATLRGASLEVIHTYEHKPDWMDYAYGDFSGVVWQRARDDIESTAEQAANGARALVNSMLTDVNRASAMITVVETDRPAQVLVERSRDAEMLVVGSRGRGGFQSLVLGSVSQQCAQHARCPLVIIRAGVED